MDNLYVDLRTRVTQSPPLDGRRDQKSRAMLEQYAEERHEAFPSRLAATYRFGMPRDLNDGMGAQHPEVLTERFMAAQMMRSRVGMVQRCFHTRVFR